MKLRSKPISLKNFGLFKFEKIARAQKLILNKNDVLNARKCLAKMVFVWDTRYK